MADRRTLIFISLVIALLLQGTVLLQSFWRQRDQRRLIDVLIKSNAQLRASLQYERESVMMAQQQMSNISRVLTKISSNTEPKEITAEMLRGPAIIPSSLLTNLPRRTP